MTTRILVADDSDVVRQGIRHLLGQHEGWEVCGETANGRDALAMTSQRAPHAVVLDFAVPGMNGIEATRPDSQRTTDRRNCSVFHVSRQPTCDPLHATLG